MSYPLSHYEKHDPTFAEDLLKSQKSVWAVARWLQERFHLPVSLRPINIRPKIEDMLDYVDQGDIEVIRRIEVKHRNVDFTHAGDYPYRTVSVTTAPSFDRANPKPTAYIIVNRAMTHCIIINVAATRKDWVLERKHWKAKMRDQHLYMCPVELCQFYAMLPATTAP
jgi:hypothetical protein